jgi:hypothetical protein
LIALTFSYTVVTGLPTPIEFNPIRLRVNGGTPVEVVDAPVLDQTNIPAIPALGGLEMSSPVFQTFTVGIGGQLTGVDLQLSRLISTTATLSVSVRNGTTILGSATISPSSDDPIFGTFGVIPVDFSSFSIDVNVGDELNILVVSSESGVDTCDEWCWGGSLENVYPDGSHNGLGGARDMGFSTYVAVAPPAVPSIGSVWGLLTLSGLLLISGSRYLVSASYRTVR